MKKNARLNSLSVKFFLLFVGILWVSTVAAFVIIFFTKWNTYKRNIETDILTKARYFQTIYDQNPAQLNNLVSLVEDKDTKVSVFSSYQEVKNSPFYRNAISQSQYNQIMSGTVLSVKPFEKHPYMPFVGVKAGGNIVLIHPRSGLIGAFRGIAYVLLICAGLGSVLVAVAASVIARPIRRLSTAAKEVAKGNFNIRVETKSGDEIGKLTENFNLMTDELKSMEVLRKNFISNVSHEFKTPITAIQGFAKVLRDKKLTKEQSAEYTDIIISETGRLANLSNNLLRLSRLENQPIHEKFAAFSLDEQLRRVILLLEGKWNSKHINFELELDEVRYCGDEEMLQQVWINLIANAIKFSDDGDTIEITLKRAENTVKAEITDSGPGVADEDKDKIFEMFYKGEQPASNEGNGLGLSIVKKIVELHNGRVYFESALGVGTTFTVELPFERDSAAGRDEI